jgi:hypothetical protein
MDGRDLEIEFGAQLVPQGFKKKASSWYRQIGGVLQVVNLQKSSFGEQFYVNLCFAPITMEIEGMPTPKEHRCPVRIRLTAAFPEHKEELDNVFDLESPGMSKSERKIRIAGLVKDQILPYLVFAKDVPSLHLSITEGRFRGGSVNLAVRTHLGIAEVP